MASRFPKGLPLLDFIFIAGFHLRSESFPYFFFFLPHEAKAKILSQQEAKGK